ncbi:hypothetical protein CP552_04475 [Sphingomonas melonis]|nr:hypothetical protein CP552_04475 [Sphingomonas melonis]MBI0532696.1 hypothetical protein [Sphingomonas sp. TX0522]
MRCRCSTIRPGLSGRGTGEAVSRLSVIPANAGIHGCGVSGSDARHERRASMDPGVRRDDG